MNLNLIRMMKTFIQDNGGTIAWEQINRNYFTFYKPIKLAECFNGQSYYRLSIKEKTVTISSISIEVPSDFDVALRHHGDGGIKRKEIPLLKVDLNHPESLTHIKDWVQN